MKTQTEMKKQLMESSGVRMILAFAIPIVVVLVIIMIYVILKPEPVVENKLVIDNFAELLPEVPDDTKIRIEERLYEQVASSGVEEVPQSGAMIRIGSIDGFTLRKTFHVGDFIVDIAAIEQSYIIKYHYGELEGEVEMEAVGSVMLYCIEKPEEMIYDSFRCNAGRDFVKPDAIQYILPRAFDDYELSYTYSLSSKSGYAVVVTYDPPESVYLSGKLEEFENESMGKIRSFLEQYGISPDDYEYIIKYRVVR